MVDSGVARTARRTLAFAVSLGAALLGAPVAEAAIPTCPPPPSHAAELAPADADLAAHFEPTLFDAGPTGKGLARLVGLDLQLGDLLALQRRCFATATRISVAGADAEFVWLIEGPGAGSEATVDCYADWRRRGERGQIPWARPPREGAGACFVSRRGAADGPWQASAGPNHFIVASAKWADTAESALADPQRAGSDARPRSDVLEALGMVAKAPHAFAGSFHRPDTLVEPGPWKSTVRNLAVSLEVGQSGELSVLTQIETRDFGDSVVAALRQAVPTWTARAHELGLPGWVVAQLGLETQGKMVRLRWTASPKQLHELGGALAHEGRGGGLF